MFYFENKNGEVVIKEVLANSEAFKKGIIVGDTIKKINSKPITTISDVKSYLAISRQKNISQAEIQIIRDKAEQTIYLKVMSDD